MYGKSILIAGMFAIACAFSSLGLAQGPSFADVSGAPWSGYLANAHKMTVTFQANGMVTAESGQTSVTKQAVRQGNRITVSSGEADLDVTLQSGRLKGTARFGTTSGGIDLNR